MFVLSFQTYRSIKSWLISCTRISLLDNNRSLNRSNIFSCKATAICFRSQPWSRRAGRAALHRRWFLRLFFEGNHGCRHEYTRIESRSVCHGVHGLTRQLFRNSKTNGRFRTTNRRTRDAARFFARPYERNRSVGEEQKGQWRVARLPGISNSPSGSISHVEREMTPLAFSRPIPSNYWEIVFCTGRSWWMVRPDLCRQSHRLKRSWIGTREHGERSVRGIPSICLSCLTFISVTFRVVTKILIKWTEVSYFDVNDRGNC